MATIKSAIRQILNLVPVGRRQIEAFDRRQEIKIAAQRLALLGDRAEVFTHHFQNNEWRNEESVSGSGSTLEYTQNLRAKLPGLLHRLSIRSMLDAPCGDFNWFSRVDLSSGINYIGADIVEPLIAQNRERFSRAGREFQTLDIVGQDLPGADLWMCRDCLIHLSHEEIFSVLANFLKSEIRYLLTTTYPNCPTNYDIPTGSFRQLNLELKPFYLGEPLERIEDWIEGFPVRQLALWDRDTLAKRLASNRHFAEHCRSNSLSR